METEKFGKIQNSDEGQGIRCSSRRQWIYSSPLFRFFRLHYFHFGSINFLL